MEFNVFDLGLISFQSSSDFQKEVFKAVKYNHIANALILCRHHPVITLGRRANRGNILIKKEELDSKKIQVFETERGGDVTYHGPGQLTVYPIFNLNYLKKDIHFFLRKLEDITISFLSDFGLNCQRREGLTGVWQGVNKIASIGISIKNWITFHGLSINIKKNDLENFGLIRPCGMDIEVTSLETLLAKTIEIGSVKEDLIRNFTRRLNHG